MSSASILPAYNGDTDEPAGYILPLRRRQPAGRIGWSSQLWFARPERLVLTAGDSPIGFRIPTEGMPWVAPDELEYEYEAAPFAERVKLPADRGSRMDLFQVEAVADPLPPLSGTAETATELIRSRRCACKREKAGYTCFYRMRRNWRTISTW